MVYFVNDMSNFFKYIYINQLVIVNKNILIEYNSKSF